MYRTCASCCVQQAQPFRVLGRNVPAESLRSAQRPRKDTAYTSLLGSVAGQSAGTAASPSIPGFILGCGPSRPASLHPVRVDSWHYQAVGFLQVFPGRLVVGLCLPQCAFKQASLCPAYLEPSAAYKQEQATYY